MNKASTENKHLSLIIPSLNTGGAERVFSILANNLIDDYNITLFILYKCDLAYSINNNIEVVFCKEKYTSKQSILYSIKNNFSFIKYLKKEITKRNSDLILSFTTTTNIYATIIGKQLKIPSIISERLHPDFNINSFWKLIRKRIYPSCSRLVVQTQSIKAYFTDFIAPEKISVIENPIAPELTKQKESNPQKEKIILNIGRLTHQKNQDLLIRSFSKVTDKSWKLCILGEGDKRKEYQELAIKLGITDKITFTGSIQNVSEYLNSSSIFVLCSLFEGFPNALIEAMYFGLPCIATNCPSGPEDIIITNENGILIPMNDEYALTTVLNMLIANENLRKTLGNNAEITAQRFEVNTIMNTWIKLIKSAMA